LERQRPVDLPAHRVLAGRAGRPTTDTSDRVASHRAQLELVVAVIVTVGLLVELLVHGLDVDAWGTASNAALGVAALASTLAVGWRLTTDRRGSVLLFVLASAWWAVGQLTRVTLHIAGGADRHWPRLIDLWFAATPMFVLFALGTRLWRREPVRRVALVVDSVVMAVALVFVAWELWLRDRVEGASALEQITRVGVPTLDLFVASLAIVMVLQQRTATMTAIVALVVSFTVGDLITAVTGGPFGGPGGVAGVIAWGTFLVLLTRLAATPSRPGEDNRRPEVVRMIAVYVPATVSMTMAVSRYLLGQHPISAFSGVLAMVFVIAVTFDQGVRAWESSEYSQQLTETIHHLAATEQQLRDLLDDLPEAVVVIDRGGIVRDANAVALHLTGRDADALIGRDFRELVAEDSRDLAGVLWQHVQEGADFQGTEVTLPLAPPAAEGLIVAVDAMLPVRHPDGVVVTLRDVTSSLREAEALERARERFRLAFHGAPTGMTLATVDTGRIVDVNEPMLTMLGAERDQVVGRTVRDITHTDDWERNNALLVRAATGTIADYALEKRYVRQDGSVVWAQTSVSVFEDNGELLAIAHVQDITEQRRAAEQLRWAATHDELTRLPNRSQFTAELTDRLVSAPMGTTAVLFIDLDNFKVVNDSLGHAIGDQLLRGMTQRLRAVLRDHDMLSRFGGDEFIVMLTDYHGELPPLAMAERLRKEIARPLTLDGVELFVTGSIGIAIGDRPGASASDLLRDADAAMYRAKARGRDCVEVFAPGVHDASVATLRTTNELRRGIERDEIVPYYQPIVDLDTGVLTGFEVLARWRHPDRGLLGPDQFLPMAEETGIINDVGSSILRASLAQLGQWRERVPSFSDLSIAVNVSSRQLLGGEFIEVVRDALAESGVPAGSLWLEITETALMADVKAASIALRELRGVGLHLSVDDFGTGYSSLTYLKRFPVEAIKVDRSFVNGLGIDNEDSTIVEAVVRLGHSLGLAVVAEGVETPLQLSRLRELGCDRGQGYLFGRPRPAEIVEAERAAT
jgi:diguanylate cyclase (GGDEF)-like protein/PAS domain S-box-containing protein